MQTLILQTENFMKNANTTLAMGDISIYCWNIHPCNGNAVYTSKFILEMHQT